MALTGTQPPLGKELSWSRGPGSGLQRRSQEEGTPAEMTGEEVRVGLGVGGELSEGRCGKVSRNDGDPSPRMSTNTDHSPQGASQPLLLPVF